MKSTKMLVSLIAVVATSALTAGGAFGAKPPPKLDLTWGASPEEFQLKAGDEFTLRTSELTIATSSGNVVCGESRIRGTDRTNDEQTDTVELTGNFTETCVNGVTTLPGEVSVNLGGDVGVLSLSSNGKAQLNTQPKLAGLQLHFTDVKVACNYTWKRLNSKVTVTHAATVLEDKFSAQKLKLDKASSDGKCFTTVAVSAVFDALTNGGSNLVFEHIH